MISEILKAFAKNFMLRSKWGRQCTDTDIFPSIFIEKPIVVPEISSILNTSLFDYGFLIATVLFWYYFKKSPDHTQLEDIQGVGHLEKDMVKDNEVIEDKIEVESKYEAKDDFSVLKKISFEYSIEETSIEFEDEDNIIPERPKEIREILQMESEHHIVEVNKKNPRNNTKLRLRRQSSPRK